MITIRKGNQRGHADHGWLDSHHTFSFANYYDPQHMGFRDLRVINEDRVKGGGGFGTHPHRDMEIITYVLEGALEHRDSMGNGSPIRPGDVQRMSAGTGVAHSEYNASETEPVHFMQIWLLPRRRGIAPSYEQKHFTDDEKLGRLRVIASPDGRDGSVAINQDAELHASLLEPGISVTYEPAAGRHGWLQVATGAVTLNGTPLVAGDGAAISDEPMIEIAATERSEILLFDLA